VIVRFTKPAARQLDEILDYIAAHSLQGAEKVFDRIEETLSLIAAQPSIGRATNRAGFRRVNLYPYPYAILYRASTTEIIVHAIRHAARRPPPK
jgi:plasmid stabilization system protein ParE